MTRSIIVFRDTDGNIVMILYIGHDGYESGIGVMLARARTRVMSGTVAGRSMGGSSHSTHS